LIVVELSPVYVPTVIETCLTIHSWTLAGLLSVPASCPSPLSAATNKVVLDRPHIIFVSVLKASRECTLVKIAVSVAGIPVYS
jgi:hypothetical protein